MRPADSHGGASRSFHANPGAPFTHGAYIRALQFRVDCDQAAFMSTLPADALPSPAASGSIALSSTQARVRLQSIDVLRGFVIALMALDHVRAYFTGVRFDPLDLSQTDAAWFATRWITHLCAPTFIFLSGVSAYLISRRCELKELRRFLVTRGLWLIALEVTVVQFGWSFNFRYEIGLIMQVIWAIGASMVVLAALVHLPQRAIGAIAVIMIAGHNLLDGIQPEAFGQWAPVWNLIHVQGRTSFAFVIYPLVPWVGVMALGFYAGSLFEMDSRRRRSILLGVGAISVALFIALRAANGYGDPHPWTSQATPALTLMSFINVHKYPPSLLYLLITLGLASLLLARFETMRGKVVDVMDTFGRVPLFFYVLHILLAHFAAGLIALATGHGDVVLTNLFLLMPDQWGFDLPGVYVAWIAVLIALYPPCRWFAEVKRRRRDWWLSYL